MRSFLLLGVLLSPTVSFLSPLECHRPSTQLYGLFRKTGKVKAPINGDPSASFGSTASSPSNVTDSSTVLSGNETRRNESDVTGIGGMGGVVYDVNRLKRNLLQETMQAYKSELWDLLLAGEETAIVDKLAELVQASPVRTTTDSNLLDGSWCLAYTSKQASVADLKYLMDRRSVLTRAEPVVSGSISLPSLWKTRLRTFHLEEVEDDEDAHVVDETRFAGCLSRTRRSAITGLTRNSLRMHPLSTEYSAFGQVLLKRKPDSKTDVADFQQVVYCDVDLCIVAPEGDPEQSFQVYTKNAAWLDPKQRFRNKVRSMLSSIRGFVSTPVRWLRPKNRRSTSDGRDLILREIQADDSAKLRVLKLGDVSDKDDEAWDGLADPFVHLSAEERQEELKKMNLRQIARAGNSRQSKSWRDRMLQRLFRRRKTYFRKPDDH